MASQAKSPRWQRPLMFRCRPYIGRWPVLRREVFETRVSVLPGVRGSTLFLTIHTVNKNSVPIRVI